MPTAGQELKRQWKGTEMQCRTVPDVEVDRERVQLSSAGPAYTQHAPQLTLQPAGH